MIVERRTWFTSYEMIFVNRDAALACANIAIASLAELAADLHAHEDTQDDLDACSYELESMLLRMEDIGRFLIAASDPTTQVQTCNKGDNYIQAFMESHNASYPGDYPENRQQLRAGWKKTLKEKRELQRSIINELSERMQGERAD